MKIGITGADDAVGRALLEHCAGLGHDVEGVHDVRDGWRLATQLAGCEVVVHAAEIGPASRARPGELRAANADCSDLVFRMARRAGVRRVVHLSSSAVYGIPERWPVPEDAPLRPVGPYGRSKLEAESHAWRHIDDGYDLSVLRLRPVMGPGVPGDLGRFLFPALARRGALSRRLPVVLPSRGRNRCQLTARSDLEGVLGALLAEGSEAAPGVYNIGAATPRSFAGDLAALFAGLSHAPRLLTTPEGPGTRLLEALYAVGLGTLAPETLRLFDTDVVLDTSRASEVLGFTPTEEPVEVLRGAFDWWLGAR